MPPAFHTVPTRVDHIPGAVQDYLEAYFQHRSPETAGISPVVEKALSVMENFVIGGGKRVRPTFAWLGWLGAQQIPIAEAPQVPGAEKVLAAVSSLELLQACALIHDDIIDSSDTRRGNPTVHRQFSDSHMQQSWRGHGESFGRSLAILVGDLALNWADDIFVEAGLSPEQLIRAWEPWRMMRTEVVCGQILDITAEAQGDGSVLTANKVNRFKTAAYTVERPLHIGASIAGGSNDCIAALRAFGRDIGIAYQLRDDQLGVFGDPEVTGKPAGDDLREGKRTLLVALTLEHASSQGRRELESALGTPLTSDDVARLKEIITDSGAPGLIEEKISSLVDSATETLLQAPISDDVQEALLHMAKKSTERQR